MKQAMYIHEGQINWNKLVLKLHRWSLMNKHIQIKYLRLQIIVRSCKLVKLIKEVNKRSLYLYLINIKFIEPIYNYKSLIICN